ncbi:MAG: hypothetical protein ACRDWI_05715 [Jiangellaceae bacterium]
MTTWLIRTGLALVVNAVTLAVAAGILDLFTIDAAPFVVAVVIFTAAAVVFKAAAYEYAGKFATGLTWVAGLVATWLGLLVTNALSDGISIRGFMTWVWATLIVWAAALIYDFVDDTLIEAVRGRLGGATESASG